MKLLGATYVETGRDSQHHEIGTVTVTFYNGRLLEFEEVDARDFKAWRDSGYDRHRVPYDMAWSFWQWWSRFETLEQEELGEAELLANIEEPDEEESLEEHIRDDDHLGQVTGFPSPGFEPEEE